ncbi:MAG: glycosyltransferase [Alphaproteobacteria bacterium]
MAMAPVNQTPPRILLHVFSTLSVGGQQVRFATLVNNGLGEFVHRLFAMDGQYESMKLFNEDAPCEIFETRFTKGNTAGNVLAFRRALNTLRPDILVTYNWGAIEWAMANFGRSCPHIHIVDGFGPEEAEGQLQRRVLFRRLAFWRNTTTVVPSRTLYEIATKTWRLPPGDVAFIPNGIDCTRFDNMPDPAYARQLGLDGAGPVIGTVAALRPEKNLTRLIEAFAISVAKNPAIRLVIVGDGAERPALEAAAIKFDVAEKVTFTGYIADPAPVLSLFDIFALSSDTEQMPISVLEAMAARLPVAGVDVGDVRHIVSDPNRPLIVNRDARALADILSTLAGDADLRDRIGQANRRHAESHYSQADMVSAYTKLFSA